MAVRVRAVVKIDDGVLKKAQTVAPRVMAKVLRDAADKALRRIKGGGPQPAPVRTGRLRRGYFKRVTHRGLRVLIANTETPYAGFVEFGTRFMGARPHFRPAVKAMRKFIKREANRRLALEFKKL